MGARAVEDRWVTWRSVALHLSVLPADAPAPTVVFVHGMSGSAAMFSGMVPGSDFLAGLRDEGFSVVALDLQGHGLSDGRRGHIPFRDAIGNIGEAVGYAHERFGAPVALCGSGLGGTLAFYAALEDDRVAAVACHTLADLRQIGRFEERVRRRALAWLVGRGRQIARAAPFARLPLGAVYAPQEMFDDPENLARWRAFPRIVRTYTIDSLVSLFLTPDDKPAVESMTRPVLVVTGENDRVVPLAWQRDVADRLGPGADLSVVARAGHMLPLEQRAPTVALIANWLRKVL